MFEILVDHLSEKAPVIIMIPFLVIVALLVHELGHYITARLSGMRVERVVLGFGKCLWKRTDRNGTDWFVHLWPFKAYVGIRDFDAQKDFIFRRLAVVMAGPLASLILPALVMFCFFVAVGKPAAPALVTGVEIDTPAYEAGVKVGDKIISINGQPISYAAEILPFTREKQSAPLLFELEKNGGIRTANILPEWHVYRDEKGLIQEHGRVGILLQQQPYQYDILKDVDGIDIDDTDKDRDHKQARTLISERLGKSVKLGLKSSDRKVHHYLVDLPQSTNRSIMDENHDDYGRFYVGTIGDNYYRKLSIKEAADEAVSRNLEIIRNVAKAPFQLFPIDKQWVMEDYVVSNRSSAILYYIYRFVFLLSLLSVFIGLINLIPFPGLDGSVILIDTVEAVRRKNLTRKGKALWICGALIIFYAAVITANAPDMEGYYGFLIDKVTASND